ncbi:MAG: hypothetical protein QM690_21545, partial [Sphingobium sp.]
LLLDHPMDASRRARSMSFVRPNELTKELSSVFSGMNIIALPAITALRVVGLTGNHPSLERK